MPENQSTGKTFFHTLPGIITAIAGLITAVGGFILILNKTGCVSSKQEKTEQHINGNDILKPDNEDKVVENTLNSGKISYSPTIIKHLTRYLVYNISDASAETLPNGEIVLNVKIKCTNNSDYEYHFYSTYIGARIRGDNYGPEPYSPSGNYVAVPARSFRDLEYNFKLPRGTKNFDFVFYDVENEIGLSAFRLN